MKHSARRIVVTGRVQGVGYRPFVYVTAHELGLTGSVLNGSGKVFIHAEGEDANLDRLENALIHAAPPLARPNLAESEPAEFTGAARFEILASNNTAEAEIHVPPDLYTCDDCVLELTTPDERRYGYPFINCTQCGPRYTIITAMPYDRPNTSMAGFPLCDDCRAEYESPLDRRFHAQPLACPRCGPQLAFSVGASLAREGPGSNRDVGASLAREGPGSDKVVGASLAREGPGSDKVVGASLAREGPGSNIVVGASLAREGSGSNIVVGASLAREGSGSNIVVGASLAREGPGSNIVVGASLARENTENKETFREQGSLLQAVQALKDGLIVAVKGVGGYHLVCDAANDEVVVRLRERKHRPHKPLAVMFPITGADGLDAVRECLIVDETITQSILDPARPIVLAQKGPDFRLSTHLAPGLRELGAFLPYSPLHHQLMREFGAPIVATSGNISGEPVITDQAEVEKRLARVADAFLHHNRPIVRPADDPVMRPIAGRSRVIRLGRGIAPVERTLPGRLAKPVLAVGGHLKVTVALAWDDRVVISPHIGELDSNRSMEVFSQVINNIQELYDVKSHEIICDLHPGYASTRYASQQSLPVVKVQHHAAHASALAGEHPDISKWLIFAWDGVGYGSDGTLWGGEALAGSPGEWNRVASFRPFKLAGGDKAGRQPWRSAAALLWESAGARHAGEIYSKEFAPEGVNPHGGLLQNLSLEELNLAHQAWQQNINTHQTSAVGRLFDAAAALILGRTTASFEGQGPMELEQIASPDAEPIKLPLAPDREEVWRSDWTPLLPLLQDQAMSSADRAGIFHATMAQALADQVMKIREQVAFDAVGLSGGVFQNRLLSELVVRKIEEQGIDIRLHEDIPANDGGLCFGQVMEALYL